MFSSKKADIVLLAMAVLVALFAFALLDARRGIESAQARITAERVAVRRLTLTDLALFTEARYTRHLTQADRHAAFQDHPLSLEHFPSGSLVAAPKP